MSAARATFTLDGLELPCEPGQTILEAAVAAGRTIPHLCWHPGLGQSGACRLCTVRVDGQLGAACTTRVRPDSTVECRTEELDDRRRMLLQMLFVEGNHFCPGCEKSGDCALQAAAYEVGMTGPHFEEFFPSRPVDASHPDVWLDLNRCILCKLCVRASTEVDGKGVFAIAGHGIHAHVIVDSPSGRLGDSRLAVTDLAAHICPVGAILPKRRGFAVPIGQRRADLERATTPAHLRALADTQRQDDRG
ncbi:MAG: 2Fe-2S iron-sulfur cluster-binding protein [Ideonella sp.]|jgi:[NiFe] hydrogenase diaphorase moiety small subunit|nr:2Fe-2S iron-sulfur cluster-binding protein [Ideonella sp.]